jgi:uncharacterized protein YmfQ (DUF2313 family)
MSKFAQALAHLLPTGFAWPRHPDSVMMRWVAGVANSFAEFERFALQTAQQWLPHRTCTREAEWEAALSLPDPCTGYVGDPVLRQALLLSRLRGFTFAYPDSSPAATGNIEAMCAALGYAVSCWYDEVFRVERDGVCERLGAAGQLFVDMHTMCQPMRVDVDGADHRLAECTADAGILLCLLQRMVPARFEIFLLVDGELVLPC